MPKIFDKKLLVIYGPTVTGKTNLAIQLAQKLDGEIISADSRQVYKSLDIGTGKVSFDEKVKKHNGYWIVDGVKIHGFDLKKVGTQFTAADFIKFTTNTVIRIIRTNKLPIVVGGTGFYIKALRDGIESIGIPANQNLRRELEKLSVVQLYKQLLKLEPERARSMNESDRANPRRLIRAIEIAIYSTSEESEPLGVNPRGELTSEVSRKGVSERSHAPASEMFYGQLSDVNCLIVGLTAPNEYLYERADKWLSVRLQKGMIEEVQNLINKNVSHQWLDNLGLECRWLSRYLLGKISKEEAIERLKGDIHNFIRRQKTWFIKFPDIKFFDISKRGWQQKLEKTVKGWYNQNK